MQEFEEVQKFYLAYLGRPADPPGLKFYAEILKSSNDKGLLARLFFNSEEFRLAKGDLNISKLIEEVYRSSFGRVPDPEGFSFWSGATRDGKIPEELLPYAIVDAARSGTDFLTLTNRIKAAMNFAKVIDPELDGEDLLVTYSGPEDVANSRRFLDFVNSDPRTLPDLSDSEVFILSRIADPEDKILKMASSKIENLLKMAESRSFKVDSFTVLPSRYDPELDPLLSGISWKKDEVTYSFNLTEDPIYPPVGEPSEIEKKVVREAFARISEFINLRFKEVISGGDIQIVSAALPKGIGGITVYRYSGGFFEPPIVIYLSDLLRNLEARYFFRNDWGISGYGVTLIFHEICHALGLKHPYEGYPVLESNLIRIPLTIMGYLTGRMYTPNLKTSGTDYEIGVTLNATPESIGILDLASLMLIYGPNLEVRRGNDTYVFKDGEFTYRVIWDPGGEDMIDASAVSRPSIIRLKEGSLSSIGIKSLDLQAEELVSNLGLRGPERERLKEKVMEYLKEVESRGILFTGEENLAIAEGCVIENVKAGNGNDTIYDNRVDNLVILNGGDDIAVLGSGGFDTVIGGSGYDILLLPYSKRDYEIAANSQFSLFVHRDFAVKVLGFEEVRFEDKWILI